MLTKKPQEESIYRKSACEYIPHMLTFLALITTIWSNSCQMNLLKQQIAQSDTLELKRIIWEKKISYFENFAETLSKAANIPQKDSIKINNLFVELEVLYWGKLNLIEDDKAEDALNDFKKNTLSDYKKGYISQDSFKVRTYSLLKKLKISLNQKDIK